MIRAFLMKYAMVGAGALLLANIAQYALTHHYKQKAALCAAACVTDALEAAAEAEAITTARLSEAWAIERAELEVRLRLSEESVRQQRALADALTRDKVAIQRRLKDALDNAVTADWAAMPVPDGVCESTARCDPPGASGGASP